MQEKYKYFKILLNLNIYKFSYRNVLSLHGLAINKIIPVFLVL